LLILIYSLTQQALWVSLVLITQFVAKILAGPLLATWSDTQDRKRVMIIADVGRAILVALIPLIGTQSLPILLVLVFCVEVLTSLFTPAANAAIPDLVQQDRLDEANGLMDFARRFSDVAFVGAAGVLVGSIGPAFAFYFDALTYLASSLLLFGLPSLASKESGHAGFWVRAREGVRFLWENRTIRITVGLLFVAASFGSVEGTLGVVLANKVLKVGATGFGIMEATMSVGSIIGALIVGQLVARISRERLFLLALLIFGLFEASVGFLPIFAWVLVAFLASGVFNLLFIVPARSILQSNAPTAIRGRLFAAFFAVMDSAQIIGALLGGLLEPLLGTPGVFILAGLLVSLAAGIVYLWGGIPRPNTPSPV